MPRSVEELAEAYRALGDEVLSRDVETRDKRGAHSTEDWFPLWTAAVDAGVLQLVLPEEYGGQGRSMVDAMRVLHALGEGCRDNGYDHACQSGRVRLTDDESR